MDTIKKDLPMAMAMAAFTGVSWYIGMEINFRFSFYSKNG
jgi:hypothetical protein